MKLTKLSLLGAASAVALTFAAGTNLATADGHKIKPIKMRWASDHSGPPHPAAIAEVFFAEQVEKKIPGSKVQIYWAKSLYNVPKGTQALTKGNLEMMTGQFGKTVPVEPYASTILGAGKLTTPGAIQGLDGTKTYAEMKKVFKDALTTKELGPKVIVAQSECTLNKTRRERPAMAKRIKEGKRVVRERFGVDPDTCTGDHSCIRLNGCPSLTITSNPDPMRKDPVATVLNSCVGCGLCGEAAHAAVLCPSFYKTSIISNPSIWDRTKLRMRNLIIGFLQNGIERRLVGIDA